MKPLVTTTKRKSVEKQLRKRAHDHNVRALDVQQIASRNHLDYDQVEAIAKKLTFFVIGELFTLNVQKVVEKPRPKKTLSPIIKKAIVQASVYKILREPEPGESKDDMIVITTYGQLRREREALVSWLNELGVDTKELLQSMSVSTNTA